MYRGSGGGAAPRLSPPVAGTPNFSFLRCLLPFSSYSGAGNRRTKKKVYHCVLNLDRAVDFQMKPAILLRLRSLIAASKTRSFLLRNLKNEVGFVLRWNYLDLIQRQPAVFKVSGGGGGARSPISVTLTDRAWRISDEEPSAREAMEPILVRNLRKLLMMLIDCQIPLEKIELIELELGLPTNFRSSIISKYPQFFALRSINGVEYLCLET